MPGTVYTVASGKGGVGKTTTSVNLAVALWREGNAVALVDADIGMANLAAVLDLEPEDTLHDVLAGRTTVGEAVIEAKDGDLMVLPGSRSLDSFADADPNALQAAVEELSGRADYVIVDTGAGLSYEDVLPLGMADGVVLVTTPDPAAFGDTMKTMEVAALLGAPIRGLVVTRAVPDTDSDAIATEIGAELLGTIPEDPAVMAATVAGDPLESHAPDSEAAAAYRDLADALLSGDEAWLEEHARERGSARSPAAGATSGTGDGDSGSADPADAPGDDAAPPAADPDEDVTDAAGDPDGPPEPESDADALDSSADVPPADVPPADAADSDAPESAVPDSEEDSARAEPSAPGDDLATGPGDDLDDGPEPAEPDDAGEATPTGDEADATSADEDDEDDPADVDEESRDEEDADAEPTTTDDEGVGDEEVDDEEVDDEDGGDAEPGPEGTDAEEGEEDADDTDEAGDDGDGEDDGDEDRERDVEDAEPARRRGGVRGWLGRLF